MSLRILRINAPVWVPCRCEEFWCRKHRQHAAECPCPPVEDWKANPYGPGPSTALGKPSAAPFVDSDAVMNSALDSTDKGATINE